MPELFSGSEKIGCAARRIKNLWRLLLYFRKNYYIPDNLTTFYSGKKAGMDT
jgi:hypothetical protein